MKHFANTVPGPASCIKGTPSRYSTIQGTIQCLSCNRQQYHFKINASI